MGIIGVGNKVLRGEELEKPLKASALPLEERLRDGIKEVDGCWEWQGDTNAMATGQYNTKAKSNTAHRLSWQVAQTRTFLKAISSVTLAIIHRV